MAGVALMLATASASFAQQTKAASGLPPVTLELVSARARTTWLHNLAPRDAAALVVWAYDTKGESAHVVAVTFGAANGQTVPLSFQPVFGPGTIGGELAVGATLTVTQPRHLPKLKQSVLQAMLASGNAKAVGPNTGDRTFIVTSAVANRDAMRKLVAALQHGIANVTGSTSCAADTPLVYSIGTEAVLDRLELQQNLGRVFELASFVRTAQPTTCGREIIYEPLQVRLVAQ